MADKKPEQPCEVVTRDVYGREYVVKSFSNPSGFVRKTAVAMEGSTKCLFAEVRMADLERMEGNQAGKSSTTKILRNAIR